jgi:DnaJ domain
MLPPRTRLDPDGYYDRLGVVPGATQAEIVTAFRGKARLLHPDVPRTGNAGAFVAVKQAYDVLANRDRRAAYDRKARAVPTNTVPPGMVPDVVIVRRPMDQPQGRPSQGDPSQGDPSQGRTPGPVSGLSPRQPALFNLPLVLSVGLAAFLCLSVYEVLTHLLAPPRTVRDDIRPNAATVAPLSPSAHQAVLYGAAPVRLAGTPNFYVVPAAGPAMLWRLDPAGKTLVALGQLPLFSSVQAIRLYRQNGMLEVLVNDKGNGFIRADHLSPGNEAAARRAYCSYNAGPAPYDGEILESRGHGGGRLELENHAVQPAVIKLRDDSGAVVVSVFLAPGGHGTFNGLPDGTFHPEFAIGELWSRACNSFAAGMRARRMEMALRLPADQRLVVLPDVEEQAGSDIPDQVFERE